MVRALESSFNGLGSSSLETLSFVFGQDEFLQCLSQVYQSPQAYMYMYKTSTGKFNSRVTL